MPLRPKGILGLLAVAAGAVLLLLALRPAAVEVEVAGVTRGPLELTSDELGETRSHDRFVVAAPVAGRLRRVPLHEGDAVAAGQVVATLAPLPLGARERDEQRARVAAAEAGERSARAQLQHASEDLGQARRERERLDALLARGLVAQQQVEQARNAAITLADEVEAAQGRVTAAAAELRGARAGLVALADAARGGAALVELHAPAAGRVLRIAEPSERVVAAGTPILVIGDLAHLEVVMEMLSTEAVKVAPGMPARLEDWGGAQPLRARVRLVEPYAFTKVSALGVEEQRTNVVLDFVDPPDGLGDGYRVTGRIVTWSAPEVLRVPLGAVFRCGTAWCAFVVDAGRARRRELVLGHFGADAVEIRGGLAAGEQVIDHPPNDLVDGGRVQSR
ncbi:MAG: efflux RND transporter periplasmic adaptor subunit [Steroidobacteraceae bacterium]